jgi:hypothetical protein
METGNPYPTRGPTATTRTRVSRQIELAPAFAAEKKWEIFGEYVDDGVSGALLHAQIEGGAKTFSFTLLERIAKALMVRLTDLLK